MDKNESYILCQPETVAIKRVVFKMEFFVKLQVQVISCLLMFCIKTISNLLVISNLVANSN
jgi:hypothetical protein